MEWLMRNALSLALTFFTVVNFIPASYAGDITFTWEFHFKTKLGKAADLLQAGRYGEALPLIQSSAAKGNAEALLALRDEFELKIKL